MAVLSAMFLVRAVGSVVGIAGVGALSDRFQWLSFTLLSLSVAGGLTSMVLHVHIYCICCMSIYTTLLCYKEYSKSLSPRVRLISTQTVNCARALECLYIHNDGGPSNHG